MTDHEENLPKRPRLSFEGEPDDGLMDLEDDLSSIPDADTSMETSQADSENHDGLEITPQSKNALLDIYAVAGRAAPQVIAPKAKDANPSTSTDTAADDAFSIGPSSVLPSGSIFDELAQEREQLAAEAEQEEAAETVLAPDEESGEVHIEDEDFGDLDSQESDEELEAEATEEHAEAEPEADTQQDANEDETDEQVDEDSAEELVEEPVEDTGEESAEESADEPGEDSAESDEQRAEDSGEYADEEPEEEVVDDQSEPETADEADEIASDDLTEEPAEEPATDETTDSSSATDIADDLPVSDYTSPELGGDPQPELATPPVADQPAAPASSETAAEDTSKRGTANFGLFVLRLVIAGILLLQACQVLFTVGDSQGINGLKATFDGAHAGDLVAWGIPVVQIVAGLLILVGVLTPVGTTLAVAISSFVALHQIDIQDNLNTVGDSAQLWIALGGAAIALGFTGPGTWAADAPRGWARRPKLSGVIAAVLGIALAVFAWISLVGGNPLA